MHGPRVDDYLSYWHQAISDGGGKVRTSDRAHTQRKLYEARVASGDSSLDAFALVCPNETPDLIFIVRKA